MKRLTLLLIFCCAVLLVPRITFAQEHDEKKEKHEVHVKVKVIEDGKETTIDTIFYEHKDHDEIMEIIELKGMPDSLMRKHMVWYSDDEHDGKRKKIVQSFAFSCDSTFDGDPKKMMRKLKFSDKDANVFFHSGDSCLEKDIRVRVLNGGKHKMHMRSHHGKKGEKIIIINDSDDVEIIEKDGMKIIKIKTSGEDNVWIEKHSDNDEIDIEVEVEVEEKDGKIVKKIKRKKNKKEKK